MAWGNVTGKPDSYTPATHNHDGTYLKLSGGTMSSGSHVIFPGTSTDTNYGGSIEFREVGLVSAAQSSWEYAPGVTFHWSGRVVGKLGLRSDGNLAWRDQIIIHSGNIANQSVNYAATAETTIQVIGYTQEVLVEGDSNTYYPVRIPTTSNKGTINTISVWRDLGGTTAVYPGNHPMNGDGVGGVSCWYEFVGRYNAWDGNGGYYYTRRAWYGYSNVCAHADAPGGPVSELYIWLRGGGTNYKITTSYPATTASIYYTRTNAGSEQHPSYVEPRTELGNLGKLSKTYYGDITGNAASATTASSVAWSGVSSKPDTATRWPAWSEVTDKPSTFSPSSHDHDSRYLRRDVNDSTGFQYTFSKTNDHAIQVGTVRGYSYGANGRAGEYIHMYERVHIGSPIGWGSREAPTYGLSTYGGAWLATDAGDVGIGTTTPQTKLHVNGKFHVYYATESAPTDDLFASSFASFGEYNDDALWIGKDTSSSIWLQAAYKTPSTAKYKLLLNPLGGNVGIGTSSPTEQLEVSGNIKATSFIKSGGTSSQFLKADGSVDSNSYSTTSHTHSYLPLSGGTMNNGSQIVCRTNDTNSSSVYNGGIQLREYNGQTTSLEKNAYNAPGITFHWGGWWAGKLYLLNNNLYWESSALLHEGNWSTYCAAVSHSHSEYASSSHSHSWSSITNKPINFKAYSGSLASEGWKTLQGNNSSPSIAISYNNSAAAWNSGTYSATMVWGCSDTRGMIDCAYNAPTISFGGCTYGNSTDNAPAWYIKLTGTSGTTYNLDTRWALASHTHSEYLTSLPSHDHDGRYHRYYRYTTAQDANSMVDGWHDIQAYVSNCGTTSNHGTLIQNSYNGTPFQIWIPDVGYYIYKRYNSGSIGGTWSKIYAGYADSVPNLTNTEIDAIMV